VSTAVGKSAQSRSLGRFFVVIGLSASDRWFVDGVYDSLEEAERRVHQIRSSFHHEGEGFRLPEILILEEKQRYRPVKGKKKTT